MRVFRAMAFSSLGECGEAVLRSVFCFAKHPNSINVRKKSPHYPRSCESVLFSVFDPSFASQPWSLRPATFDGYQAVS
jgi:hypothetical protein